MLVNLHNPQPLKPSTFDVVYNYQQSTITLLYHVSPQASRHLTPFATLSHYTPTPPSSFKMQLSLYSISVGLCLFHGVLSGRVTLMGPQLEKGAIMACVSNNYDDKGLADMLEQKDILEKRVGNNFFHG